MSVCVHLSGRYFREMAAELPSPPLTRIKPVPLRLVAPPQRRSAAEAALSRPVLSLVTAMIVGGLLRAVLVFSADFPLNDGGLFYVMIGELRHAAFRLPDSTSYNSAGIPFAYPPFGLYAAGLLASSTQLDTIELLRFLPLVISIVTVAAFYLLARSLLSSQPAQIAATFAFAVLPRSFLWMIMGGGVTRSFGLLFAILSLHQLHAVYSRRTRRAHALAIAFAALTVLSHTDMAWFLFYSAAVFFFAYGRSRKALLSSVAVAGGAALITLPWWGTVVVRHGVSTFFDAGGSREYFSAARAGDLLRLNLTGEPLLPILTFLGLLGVLACLTRGRFFLPLWLAAAVFLSSWVLQTTATVPLALLVGIGVTDFLVDALGRLSVRASSPESNSVRLGTEWLSPALLTFLLVYATISALVAAPTTLAALPKSEREAMAWAAHNTPPSSRYLVITGEPWWRDRASEWFPALASRASVATPQGLEWLRGNVYRRRVDVHEIAQACASQGADCLRRLSVQSGITFSHVYISKLGPGQAAGEDCCVSLRASLLADPSFAVLYDGPGATIFGLRK